MIDVIKEILEDFVPKIIPDLVRREEERLLTKKEAMKILTCSETTLWRMEKAGLIQSVGIGKHKRYRNQSIVDYISGNVNIENQKFNL